MRAHIALVAASVVAAAKIPSSCPLKSSFPNDPNTVTLASATWTVDNSNVEGMQVNVQDAYATLQQALQDTTHHICSQIALGTTDSAANPTVAGSTYSAPIGSGVSVDIFFRNDGGLVWADLQSALGWIQNLLPRPDPNNPDLQTQAIHGNIQNAQGDAVGNFNVGVGLTGSVQSGIAQ